MVIQNINTQDYYAPVINSSNKPSNDEIITNETKAAKSELNMDKSSLKNINAPTKIYIDNVISNAIDNIKKGNNIEDNKRIVRLFSNLIQENSETVLRKAYGL